MHGYKCDICGCYLDPGEGRQCDECQQKSESRVTKMKKMSESVRISDSSQYKMIMEVV